MENNNKNLTIWQRLTKAFGPNSLLNQDYPTYNFDRKELLKTTSKQEFEKELLQAQQSYYLANQWTKIENNLYTQAVYYEPTRLASFYDYESMEFSIVGETKIATPNGFVTIAELAEKGRDYEFITYAYDHNLNKVVPALARNAHYTRDEMTYKITFDDGSHIIATYGHRFLKRDGTFCEVENLQIGDSMMPFYRKSFYNNEECNWIYTCNPNEGVNGWVKEDIIVSELSGKQHNSNSYRTTIPWDLIIETAKQKRTVKATSEALGVKITKLMSTIESGGFKNWGTFMEAYNLKKGTAGRKKSEDVVVNHKIVSIEPYGVVPVYDLTVPGYKNFATDTIFSHNTPEIAAALDIYGEESTTPDQYGNILQIYSESKRVKSILEDLFYNTLDINTNLQMWTRNTPVREDSVIPLLDGTEITIKHLSDRVKNGEEIWSYAIQDGTNAIVPSKIIWCDLTRKDSELVRVTLDDGTHIDTTPDHEYMLRDGTFKRADELNEGQSLMPFYTLTSIENKNKIAGYEKIYNPKNNRYQYTHRIVANECVTDLEYEKTVNSKWLTHHVNFKKKDNSPKNLRRMTFEDHSILHQKYSEHLKICRNDPYVVKKRMEGIDRYLRSDKRRLRLSKEMSGIYPKYFEQYNNSELHIKHNEIRSEKMLKNWRSNEFVEKTKNNMTIQISDTCLDYISNIIVKNKNYIGIYKLAEMLKKDKNFIPLFKETYGLRKDITKSINSTTLKKVIFRKTNKNYFDFILSLNPNLLSDKNYNKSKAIYLSKVKYETPLNHKVVSIIRLNETSDVYCLEAVGPNGEHDRHNFPICGKDVNGSYSRTSGVFLSNCKYGDNFVYLKLDSEKGIVGCMQLPNIEIERLERGMPAQASRSASEEPAENKGLRFKWKAKDMEFNSWEIAHFRLLGDDRKLPYGSSMLEKARRTWKQLTLAEDAMLIYRTSRAPERRVFKVFVGNMDDADVEPYVQRVANKFKRSQVVDSKTGNVDLRFNQMAVDQDYFIPVRDPAQASPIDTLPGACISLGTEIPLLDGRILKLSEIIDIWDNGGRDLWVYSCDPITGKIAPGQITWAGVTRRDANVVKITLDNGETLVTTPDHKFVHRTNGFVEAQNLSVGDSLMPFYRREEKIRSNTNKYEQVWDNEAQQWVFTHRMVSEFFGETNGVNDLIIDEIDYVNGDVIDYYNHKIVDIEYLEITQDTGTITVDGNEIYHNYHTFATKSGVFIKNSNLSEIADIEYIQKKLLTALRVPKAFLGFEEVVGEGKNLSLQDIRFARTINRIQKAMISELNKIAIIHLFLLGFEDELNNFVLGLTNPSSQADLLRIDVWKEKIALYKEAVTAIEGIAPTSVTWAKKTILGFSDEDVKLDLQQQRVEKAVGAELTNTATIITRTGIFDNVDKLYADKFSDKPASAANQAGAQTGEPIMGGGADMSASMGADMGLPPAGGADLTPEGTKKDNMNILLESESLIDSDSFIDLSKGSNYLGEIEDKLSKLLRD